MNNYKVLFHFLKGRMRYLVVSLIMITIIQCLNFISPLVVKTLLDDYIMGIEYDWVEVIDEDEYTVNYLDRIFKQERYLDNDDKETAKFLQQMLENQKITMPTMSSIYFKETNSYSRTLFLKYNRKAIKIRILNNYAKNYGATIDVSNGYSHAIEKLLQQFDAKDVLFPALEGIFKKVTKRVRINVTDIELEFGELPEEILRLIDDYNESLNIDITAAVDEHTKMVEDENKDLKEQRKKHLEELEALKQELLEAKSTIQILEQENNEYKAREEETISVMKRIYSI